MRVTLIMLLCAACQRAPAREATSTKPPATQSQPKNKPAVGVPPADKAPPTWRPEPTAGKQSAILLRFESTVFTLACHHQEKFFAGDECPPKIGDLGSVHLNDMGTTKTAKGKPVTFEASIEKRFLYPLAVFHGPSEPAGPLGNTGQYVVDGVGIWPAAAAKSLLVPPEGTRLLTASLEHRCTRLPAWPSCAYRKKSAESSLSLNAGEAAKIASAVRALPGKKLLSIDVAADIQLDEDTELERVYQVAVEGKVDPENYEEDSGQYEMVLVRDGGRFSQPVEYQIVAATDLNGDKRAELLMYSEYYEGIIYTFVAWENGKWRTIAKMTEGS